MSSKEIEKAYKKATKLLGFDLTADMCTEYEEHNIKEEIAEKLRTKYKFEFSDFEYIEGFEWKDCYLHIIKLGNPNFEYSNLELEEIDIGGYGLFY